MAKRLMLGLAMCLALTLVPEAGFAVPSKQVKTKKTSVKASGKKSSSSTRSASKKRSSSRRSESRAVAQEEAVDTGTPVVRGSSTGVAETPPLMRVIPQRDGRFLLEPLTPKKNQGPLSRPSSPQDSKNDVAAGGRGYNLYEPWNFQELVLSLAKGYTGTRYSRGGNLETGTATDCSGFVQYIYNGFKIKLPRSSAEQAQVGRVVTQNMDFSKLVPGDLLFFRRGGRAVGHAGIYLGEGKMIHASNHRNGVIITDLRQPYYQNTFVVAKRVFEVKYPK
uniref:NlpC/P60 family protein n=1 Tax=Desulfobacca acetoxidans TaxID=60893 RepID=A0A7V4GAE6_9BACT